MAYDEWDSQEKLPAELASPWRLKQWFPDLSDKHHQLFDIFKTELLGVGSRLNLISARTVREMDAVHFFDCIAGARLILGASQAESLYDVGAGNGFPGVIMAILAAERKIVMVERDQRKMEFLRHVAHKCGLKNIDFKCQSSETLPKGSVAVAVSRAYAPLPKALLALRHLFPIKGEYFHFKANSWVSELASVPPQIISLWKAELVGEYKLPVSGSEMSIVRTIKTKD